MGAGVCRSGSHRRVAKHGGPHPQLVPQGELRPLARVPRGGGAPALGVQSDSRNPFGDARVIVGRAGVSRLGQRRFSSMKRFFAFLLLAAGVVCYAAVERQQATAAPQWELSLTASPSAYEGKCPTVIHLKGLIKLNSWQGPMP